MTQKGKRCLAALAGFLLTAGFWIHSLYGHQPVSRLVRPEQGTGSREEQLEVRMGEKTYSVDLLLKEQKLSEEQVQERLKQTSERLEGMFLNGNPDLRHIEGTVSMPSSDPKPGWDFSGM